MNGLTQGERNRLILENMDLVPPIAANYRGRRGIPFEDLLAEGTAALVVAAGSWNLTAKFPAYADIRVRGAILNFIDRWEDFEQLDEVNRSDEERIHEWAVWGSLPSEGWDKLAATPEEILGVFQDIESKSDAIASALISLTARERRMIEAHFLRQPRVGLEQIARDNRVSYKRAVHIIFDAVRKMRRVIERMDTNSQRQSPRGRNARSVKLVSFERRVRVG